MVNSTQFLVTVQTTNMVPCCSRTTKQARNLEAGQTTDVKMVSDGSRGPNINMAPLVSTAHVCEHGFGVHHRPCRASTCPLAVTWVTDINTDPHLQ